VKNGGMTYHLWLLTNQKPQAARLRLDDSKKRINGTLE
jgi:hypothetical protein